MPHGKTILVTGVTGAQGGSVARHLLRHGGFEVRGLTRHADSPKAEVLRKAGVEVVQGDLDDPKSLRRALKDCYGVFGVTNYWEHFEKESVQGRNLIEAARDAHVEHFIFSSLPGVKKATGGVLEAPHLDIKAELEDYTRSVMPGSTFVHVAFYYENFLSFFPPRDAGDGTFSFGFPQGDTPLAALSVEDTGGVVAQIFARPDSFRNRVVGVVGDDLPPAEYASIMTRVLGKKVVYHYVPREVFASLGFPGAEDLANMFEFNRLHIRNRRADLEQCHALYPGMQSFETWLQAHRSSFHLGETARAGGR